MQFILQCPCGANLKADIKYVGREMKCPKCSQKLIVPEPPIAKKSEPEVLELEVLESNELGAAQPMPAAQSPLSPVPHAAPQPPTTRKSKQPRTAQSRRNSLIIMGSVVGVAVLGFVGYLVFVYMSQRSELRESTGYTILDGRRTPDGDRRTRPEPVVTQPRPEPKRNPYARQLGRLI